MAPPCFWQGAAPPASCGWNRRSWDGHQLPQVLYLAFLPSDPTLGLGFQKKVSRVTCWNGCLEAVLTQTVNQRVLLHSYCQPPIRHPNLCFAVSLGFPRTSVLPWSTHSAHSLGPLLPLPWLSLLPSWSLASVQVSCWVPLATVLRVSWKQQVTFENGGWSACGSGWASTFQ